MKHRLSLSLLFIVAAASFAPAQSELRWGTDTSGGAPYVYRAGDNSFTGFEVDVANYLAAKLGRKSTMVDNDWSNLPLQLDKSRDVAKGIDIVLNGYELRADLCRDYAVSRPYYVYRLALLTRRDNADVKGWADLLGREGRARKTVCVLGGSSAQVYARDTFGNGIDLSSNTDVANVITLVNEGRLNATIQDTPAAVHYSREAADLQIAGEPVQPGYYVIYYRKSDAELGGLLDRAIADGIRDGTLESIYRKYGLWNADQERLTYWLDKPWPPFDIDELAVEKASEANLWPHLIEELLHAAAMTIALAFASFPLAVMAGLSIALMRVYGPGWLAAITIVYVEVIRGTPLLLQLFVVYYLLPTLIPPLAPYLSPVVAGLLGLAINYSAYESENYRAGLMAVPKGQMEAALALGMSHIAALRHVIVPQAMRIVIPPVTNDFIALFKDTSACSVILVVELTRKYNELYNFNRNLIVELAFITAGLYLLMSYPLSIVARRLERRLGSPGAGGHR